MDALCALLDCALGFFPCYFLFGCKRLASHFAVSVFSGVAPYVLVSVPCVPGCDRTTCHLHETFMLTNTAKLLNVFRYSDFASFVRGAPPNQQLSLWGEVGKQVQHRLTMSAPDSPLWLSTEGSGVPWLHIRLDSRPKYTKHASYRRVPRASREMSTPRL